VTFSYTRTYRGKIQAVILDWAGTTMDFGCMAPAVVFVEVYKNQQVPITMEEARTPMGAHKKVHIRKISQLDSVRGRWHDAHGRYPTEDDVEAMFADFVPLQLACLSDYSQLIDGTLEAVEAMRRRGMKIGSTTGYMTEMTAINLADAKRQGYEPDTTVCASEVPAGRPYPAMCMQNAINLQVEAVAACVKVDDTIPGIEEGLNAGMWSIGLACSGNEIGLSKPDYDALDPEIRAQKRQAAYRRMHMAGAHYVVDTIAEMMPCIDDIEARIARGERP
jgi:phosphonoacetaldehyde hydrolase